MCNRVLVGRLSLVVAAAFVVAGCGGGSETYSVEPTAACLRGADAAEVSTNEDDLDLIAAAAREGAVRAEVNGTEVQVAFERNADDADDTANAYAAFDVDGEKLT